MYCCKSAIEALEKGAKHVLVSLLLTFNYFTPFSSVSIVNFENLFFCWHLIDLGLTRCNLMQGYFQAFLCPVYGHKNSILN